MWFRGGSRGCPGGFFGKNRPAPWRGGGLREAPPSRGNGGARGAQAPHPPSGTSTRARGSVCSAPPHALPVCPPPQNRSPTPWNRVQAHRGPRPPTGRTGIPPAARLCPWGRRGCAQERGHAAPAWRCARVGVRVHACARTSRGHTPLGNRTYLGNKSVGTRLCCAAPGRSAGGNCRAPPGAGVGAGTGAVTPCPDPPRGLSPAWKFSGEPPPRANFGRSALGKGAAGAPVASSRPAPSLLSRCLLHLFLSLSFFLTSSLCFPSFPSFLARAFSSAFSLSFVPFIFHPFFHSFPFLSSSVSALPMVFLPRFYPYFI